MGTRSIAVTNNEVLCALTSVAKLIRWAWDDASHAQTHDALEISQDDLCRWRALSEAYDKIASTIRDEWR